MTTFKRLVELASRKGRSLKEPCYQLGISCTELETRLDALEPRVLETCAAWLGVEPQRLLPPETLAEGAPDK